MKFSCEKAQLISCVARAAKVAGTKNAIPALEGLLFEVSDKIHITGYDLKTGIKTALTADITQEGSIILNARLFGEIIRKLPDDVVTITADDKNMATIRCGMSEFNIMGTPAEDFPELPVVDTDDAIYIPQNILKSMISQTIFAISDDESRPIHTGTLFEIRAGTLLLVSVDGYRLALRKESLDKSNMDICKFVVPGNALAEVEKIASDTEDLVKITLGSKHVMFNIDDTMIVSRRLEGEFINYEQVIPADSKIILTADRKELIDAVERVSLIINDKVKSPIHCVFEDGLVQLSAMTNLGKASDRCMLKGDCPESMEIGFNNKYILDALKTAPADEISIHLNTSISPCVIKPADGGDNFTYLVLPVRLKAE